MDPQGLNDDELIEQTRAWRRRALRGEKDARGVAHELEREVRRRFGTTQNTAQPLGGERRREVELPSPARRRWKLW